MKNKIMMSSEAYATLGFQIPTKGRPEHGKTKVKIDSKNEVGCEDVSKVSSYLEQGERILDLTRKKSNLAGALELLEGIDVLKLSYKQVPVERYKQSEYFIKVIRRYIRAKLAGISDWEAFQSEGLPFFRTFLGPYGEKLRITFPIDTEGFGLEMCRDVYKSKFSVMIQFEDMPDFHCFCGIGNTKRKSSSYYHYRNKEQYRYCCLIDTEELVAHIALLNCIYMLAANGTDCSVINEYLSTHMKEQRSGLSNQEKEQVEGVLIRQEPVPLSCLFAMTKLKKKGGEFPTFKPNRRMIDALGHIFFEALQLYQDISYENTYRRDILSKSAPPYITKKNIPLKTLKAMEESKFNQFFGYVEFDEAMDLSSAATIEKEFELVNRTYFFGVTFKNVILRFRKLGRHRAGGLYYFRLNTLCVDLRSPDSYIHEYFHMLDDQLMDLSLQPDFFKVVDVYRAAFTDNMMQLPSEEVSVLKGNGKYNRNYYFRRAEIFARCGEIYLKRMLHVESSLLKQLDGNEIEYPDCERLNKEIEAYYKRLFEKLSVLQQNKVE